MKGKTIVLAGALMLSLSPGAKAYDVIGAIADKYHELGGANSFLGQPMSNEQPAPSGGRYSQFAGGVIYWHPNTGAHEVHGAILDHWTQLGRAAFGYPITDESPSPDGQGRFNQFRLVQVLPATEERSIYWSPATAAFSVVGAIRAEWARWGWEMGKLGYPTADERQDGAARRSDFQNGYIQWTAASGAQTTTVDHSTETMTDRCSSDVAFPLVYEGRAGDQGTVILRRSQAGYTDWTPIFNVGLDGDGHVRWWCHSTTGNFADPGTWRMTSTGLACQFSGNGGVSTNPANNSKGSSVSCSLPVNIVSRDDSGWTAEQSRCASHSSSLRARLGPDRLLEILCVENRNY